jgi:hypothetical protein
MRISEQSSGHPFSVFHGRGPVPHNTGTNYLLTNVTYQCAPYTDALGAALRVLDSAPASKANADARCYDAADLGVAYAGQANSTVTGKQCLAWGSTATASDVVNDGNFPTRCALWALQNRA